MKIKPVSEYLASNPGTVITTTYCRHGFFIASVSYYDDKAREQKEVTRRGPDVLSAIMTACDAAQGYDDGDPIQEHYRS